MDDHFFFLKKYLREGGKSLISHCVKGPPKGTKRVRILRQYGVLHVIVEDHDHNIWYIPRIEDAAGNTISPPLTYATLVFNEKGWVKKAIHGNHPN